MNAAHIHEYLQSSHEYIQVLSLFGTNMQIQNDLQPNLCFAAILDWTGNVANPINLAHCKNKIVNYF